MGATLVGLGVFLTFFGYKFLEIVIFILTAGAVTFGTSYGSFSLAENINKGQTKDWVIWVILVASVLIGLTAGWYLKNCLRVGKAIIAGIGGYAAGQLICHSLVISSQVLSWGIVIACAVAAVVVVFWLEKELTIGITSFIGAYCLVRGISFFVGGYPSE